jgi:glycosyltransferase involved in cell wall biosynthesis
LDRCESATLRSEFAMPGKCLTIAAAGHVTEITGPVQALRKFLTKRVANFAFATHPFDYSGVPKSVVEIFRGGKSVECRAMGTPVRCLSVLRDIFANLLWFWNLPKSDVFIGIDNVNAFCGLLLKRLGKTSKVVYYVIDYTPRRFRNVFLNRIYHWVDVYVALRADVVWNISHRIAEVRTQQGVCTARNQVVGVGVDLSIMRPTAQRDRKRLVVVSMLTEDKGIQLAISAMRTLRQRVPGIQLSIVGTGPYEAELSMLVDTLGLADVVSFEGLMDHACLFAFLPHCGIALAPYLDDPNSITYYADPTKPKEYLACGLPVITTTVPWIAELIAVKPMGIAIPYEENYLINAVERLVGDEQLYDTCSRNAVAYAQTLSYDDIYQKAMESLV